MERCEKHDLEKVGGKCEACAIEADIADLDEELEEERVRDLPNAHRLQAERREKLAKLLGK